MIRAFYLTFIIAMITVFVFGLLLGNLMGLYLCNLNHEKMINDFLFKQETDIMHKELRGRAVGSPTGS